MALSVFLPCGAGYRIHTSACGGICALLPRGESGPIPASRDGCPGGAKRRMRGTPGGSPSSGSTVERGATTPHPPDGTFSPEGRRAKAPGRRDM